MYAIVSARRTPPVTCGVFFVKSSVRQDRPTTAAVYPSDMMRVLVARREARKATSAGLDKRGARALQCVAVFKHKLAAGEVDAVVVEVKKTRDVKGAVCDPVHVRMPVLVVTRDLITVRQGG